MKTLILLWLVTIPGVMWAFSVIGNPWVELAVGIGWGVAVGWLAHRIDRSAA